MDGGGGAAGEGQACHMTYSDCAAIRSNSPLSPSLAGGNDIRHTIRGAWRLTSYAVFTPP